MKIFGDDGFRDIFGRGLLSKRFLNFFFLKIKFFLIHNKINKVVIGYDTRGTYREIIPIILDNLKIPGKIEILDRPVPTPCLAYLSNLNPKTFFIMITASHFHKRYNGFKFFFKGKKLSKLYEKKILSSKILEYSNFNTKLNYTKNYNHYLNFLNKKFKINNLKKKILIDFSFGAASSLKKKIYFFNKLKCVSYLYNFNNINSSCGSNYLQNNLKKKRYGNNDFVIAYDGDADRVLFYKKGYGVIESEKICLIFSIFLNTKSVVGTKITNPGLKKILNQIKIKYFQTNVGDRNITNMQTKKRSKIGFETSGHYSFNNYMDGIFASGLFLKILEKNEKLVDEILEINFDYKLQIVSYKNKIDLKKKINFKKYNFLKILIRKSIWSNTKRIYIFYLKNNRKEFFILLNQVKKLLK